MTRKTGEPDPKGGGGSHVPREVRGRSEDAEEAARRAEEDAARAENEGYPLGRPDEDPDGRRCGEHPRDGAALVKLRRKRYVMDPDQREHPLVQQRNALLKREAALGDELAAWARHAHYRLGGQYVTGSLRAFRTSAKLSRVRRERKRLEARMVRQGVMIPAPA